jgi:hypothetical protein
MVERGDRKRAVHFHEQLRDNPGADVQGPAQRSRKLVEEFVSGCASRALDNGEVQGVDGGKVVLMPVPGVGLW